MEKPKKIIELGIIEDLEDSGVSAISLVDEPAIEKYWIYLKQQKFVTPGASETQQEFIDRCMSVLVGDEGYEQDQAYAICINTYEEKGSIDTAGLKPYVDEVPKKKKENFIEPNPCWEGYEAYGTKMVNGREVPNCIPIENSKYGKHSQYQTKFSVDEDQKILVGPAMIPDYEIYRREGNGKEYYVKFSKETVMKAAEKFMKELRVHSTNVQHVEESDAKSYVFESWIVENKDDKANSIYKLNVPVGTWMMKMKVNDAEVWDKVKSGKYRGFSIEGNFVDQKELEDMEKDKELIEKIISILES